MPLRTVNRRYRQFQRYRQIAEVFLRQGFGYLIEQLDLHHLIPPGRRVMGGDEAAGVKSRGVRLRQALEELGPTFVKLGQMLSTRPDLVPRDIVDALADLQDRVPAVEFPRVRELIETELGRPLEESFAAFDPVPLAAASIGQVHRAVLPDGEVVAVKVRRPDIEASIEADLEVLQALAGLVEERLRPEFLRPRELVAEFGRTLRLEMDYELEARNMERFRRLFAGEPRVRIPRVYWPLTTQRVLTMDYVSGTKIDDVAALDAMGIDKRALAELGAKAFLQQVLLEGVFHGDPHPGNLFVQPDGTLAIVDFGIVGRLDDDTLTYLADLFIGLIRRETDRLVRAMIRLGAVEGTVDRRALKQDMERLIDRHYGKPLHRLKLGDIVAESFELAVRHRIHMPTDLVLLGKALLTVESTGRVLEPEFNVIAVAEPFVRELLIRRWSPEAVSRRLARDLTGYADILIGIPRNLDRVLQEAYRGNLQIQFRHQGLEKLIHRIDAASNRLVAGMIIAALVIGSSLILQSDRGPLLWGVSLVGLIGLGVAAVIGVLLVVSMLRSGRM